MIYQTPGEQFWHQGICYKVGGRFRTNESSTCEGLLGRILEIRTEADLLPGTKEPNICCVFDTPALAAESGILERVTHDFPHSLVTEEDMEFSTTVLFPGMLTPIGLPEKDYMSSKIYVVINHWAIDGECGAYEAPFTEKDDAWLQFHDDLLEEKENGCVEKWRDDPSFVEIETEESYECYLDGEYPENHFSIEVEERLLYLSPAFLHTVVEQHRTQCLLEDLQVSLEEKDAFQCLTDEQKGKFLHQPELAGQASYYLEHSVPYSEAYWQAMSETADHALWEFCQGDNEQPEPNSGGDLHG